MSIYGLLVRECLFIHWCYSDQDRVALRKILNDIIPLVQGHKNNESVTLYPWLNGHMIELCDIVSLEQGDLNGVLCIVVPTTPKPPAITKFVPPSGKHQEYWTCKYVTCNWQAWSTSSKVFPSLQCNKQSMHFLLNDLLSETSPISLWQYHHKLIGVTCQHIKG